MLLGSKVSLLRNVSDMAERRINEATFLSLSPSRCHVLPLAPSSLSLSLSKGFLMTNLSGLASLPISHYGLQLPAHPLMNSKAPRTEQTGVKTDEKLKSAHHRQASHFTILQLPRRASPSLFCPSHPLLTSSVVPCFLSLGQLN